MLENFGENYEVCNCKNITLGKIKSLIDENKVKTLRDLQEICMAGTECRKCLMEEGDNGIIKKKIYCKDILKGYING